MLQSRDTPSLLFAFCCILQSHTERMIWRVFDQYHGPGLSLLFMSHCIAYNSCALLSPRVDLQLCILSFSFWSTLLRAAKGPVTLSQKYAIEHWPFFFFFFFFLSNRLHSHHTVIFGQSRSDSASSVSEQVTMSIGRKIPWYHGNASPHSFGPFFRLTWCWRCHDGD